MEDKLIIKYIKNKKQEGLNLIIDKYGGIIRGIVRKHLYMISSYEDECINDVLFLIWNNIDSFSGEGSFKSWIGAISKFKAIDYKRKYLKLNNFESIDDVALESPKKVEDKIMKEELRKEIHSMLDTLNKKDKEIFIKYYLQDKKVDEVSEELNLTTSQIYSRLSRGRKKLREVLMR